MPDANFWLAPMGPVSPNPLTYLEEDIREHWEEFRPKMVARLKERGLYEECIQNAVTLTEEAVLEMQGNGMNLLTAWEAVREWYAILPTEEDSPTLERGEPDTWTPPVIPEDE